MKKTNNYFTFDPNGDGFEFHETLVEAEAEFNRVLDIERDEAVDAEEWNDNMGRFAMGVVLATLEETEPNLNPGQDREHRDFKIVTHEVQASVLRSIPTHVLQAELTRRGFWRGFQSSGWADHLAQIRKYPSSFAQEYMNLPHVPKDPAGETEFFPNGHPEFDKKLLAAGKLLRREALDSVARLYLEQAESPPPRRRFLVWPQYRECDAIYVEAVSEREAAKLCRNPNLDVAFGAVQVIVQDEEGKRTGWNRWDPVDIPPYVNETTLQAKKERLDRNHEYLVADALAEHEEYARRNMQVALEPADPTKLNVKVKLPTPPIRVDVKLTVAEPHDVIAALDEKALRDRAAARIKSFEGEPDE